MVLFTTSDDFFERSSSDDRRRDSALSVDVLEKLEEPDVEECERSIL